MIRILCALALLSLPLGFSGCASIDACAISSWDDPTPGVRYYMPEAYFLVTRNPGAEPVFQVAKEPQAFKLGETNKIALGTWTDALAERPSKVSLPAPSVGLDIFKSEVLSDTKGSVTAELRGQSLIAGDATLEISPNGPSPKMANWKVTLAFKITKDASGGYSIAFAEAGSKIPSATVRSIKAEVIYLPNPNRIVAIESRAGIGGVAELKVEVRDGWKLVAVNTKTDAQTPETITAIATLVEKLGSAAPSIASISAEKAAPSDTEAVPPEPTMMLLRPEYNANGFIVKLHPVSL